MSAMGQRAIVAYPVEIGSESELEITRFELGYIATNCYVVRRKANSNAIVVDPGGDAEALSAWLRENELSVDAILITHGHFDHLCGVSELAKLTGAPVWMGEVEAPALETPELFARQGYPDVPRGKVDHYLDGSESLEIAGLKLRVLLVPGHSPAHLAFHIEDAGVLLIGDVIFQGSIGRTDLPLSDGEQMQKTLIELTNRIGAHTHLLPGHGPTTTMGREITSNPFLLELPY